MKDFSSHFLEKIAFPYKPGESEKLKPHYWWHDTIEKRLTDPGVIVLPTAEEQGIKVPEGHTHAGWTPNKGSKKFMPPGARYRVPEGGASLYAVFLPKPSESTSSEEPTTEEPAGPNAQELAASKLNELKGYLTTARDVHGSAALLKPDHPRYHPDNINAYHAYNHAIDTLDNYVKGGGFDEDWEEFDKAHTTARGLTAKIMAETTGMHQASVDSEFRKLANALSGIDDILGKKELVSSWS